MQASDSPSAFLRHLPLGVAQKLAARNAPEDVVSAVVASVKSGQRVTQASVMARIMDTTKATADSDRVEQLIVKLQVISRDIRTELAAFLGSADQVSIATFVKRLIQDSLVESTSLAPMESQGRLVLERTNDWRSSKS